MTTSTDLTIRKSITVAVPPEHAYDVFVNRMKEWWPLATHSQAEEQVVDARVIDGVLVEVREDGSTFDWGDVVEADPPNRFVVNWRVNPERAPTTLAITFTAADGGTRVDLVHSGWDDAEASANYTTGWDGVLGRFSAHFASV